MVSFKKTALFFLKFVISGFLVYITLRKIGPGSVADQLAHADLFLLAAAAAVFSVSYFTGALQWWLLLRSEGVEIAWNKALSFYFIGLFFNNFLPSSLGGDVFRMVDIRKFSSSGRAAVSTVFIDRFAGLFIMSCFAVAASSLLIFSGNLPAEIRIFFILFPFGWAVLLLLLFSKRFARPVTAVLRVILPDGITSKGRDIYNTIYLFGRNVNLMGRIAAISSVVQLLRIATIYLLSLSLGVTASPVYFLLFVPVIAIAASVPVSLGGLGVRERLGMILFAYAGVPGDAACTFLFLAYLVAVVTSLPGGLIFITRSSHSPTSGVVQ